MVLGARSSGLIARLDGRSATEEANENRNLATVQASLDGNMFVLPALGSEQQHKRPLLQPGFHRTALGEPAKLSQYVLVQLIVVATLTGPAFWNVWRCRRW